MGGVITQLSLSASMAWTRTNSTQHLPVDSE